MFRHFTLTEESFSNQIQIWFPDKNTILNIHRPVKNEMKINKQPGEFGNMLLITNLYAK